ncbi:DUF6328 family protein [Streptantibioticus ferralitis]|uniref:DUF6328 family protein n=1 Tax=Streptantibioticus ferralitis TaxID=236510 RepID=A0ABT5YVH3_9ACTN|nr:DUF6328 family protein [Streptantibioticus ferralitis]MDF2255608.1 DUF6328 family protein [Streptantibioticus ferralitis]
MQETQRRTPDPVHDGQSSAPEPPRWNREMATPGTALQLTLPGRQYAVQSGPLHPAEPRAESLNRAYSEILQEVRIAQCGIQLLFASLLTLGVTPALSSPSAFRQWFYCASLACAIGAAGTLLAPAAMHRFNQGEHAKTALVAVANRCLMGGLAFLALALSSAVMLIIDIVIGAAPAVISGAAVLGWFTLLWLLSPLRTRSRVATGEPRAVHAVPKQTFM